MKRTRAMEGLCKRFGETCAAANVWLDDLLTAAIGQSK